jgi:hypothetical protein
MAETPKKPAVTVDRCMGKALSTKSMLGIGADFFFSSALLHLVDHV